MEIIEDLSKIDSKQSEHLDELDNELESVLVEIEMAN